MSSQRDRWTATSFSTLRRHHPAWRLLAADTAPFVIGFLYDCFIRPNVRALSEEAITPKLRTTSINFASAWPGTAPTGSAREYLHGWADNAKGWLRRYYPLNPVTGSIDLRTRQERLEGPNQQGRCAKSEEPLAS